MIRNKDTIIQEKSNKLYAYVKSYLDEMDSLSDTNDFTMNNIEKMWGSLEDTTKQIIRELNEDMISAVNEKEIIKVKKKSTQRKE
jgi:hypothetical protein